MSEPIPFFGWLDNPGESIVTTFTTEDRKNADRVNVTRMGFKTLDEASHFRSQLANPYDHYIVELKEGKLLSPVSNVLAYYVIHKNQEL